MKKIKFRGKRIDNGEYVFGDLIQLPPVRIINEIGEFAIDAETIAQFCGYDDISGEEIYSGDSVTISRYKFYPPERPINEPVEFVKCSKTLLNCIATVEFTAARYENLKNSINGFYRWINSENSDFRFCLYKNFKT